ncbi:MAG: LPP20 family lipoprotein [Alteromonadaceae bacterium]|nr:LPP20 family lipoprotein [Alteromonadaceae bacterium]
MLKPLLKILILAISFLFMTACSSVYDKHVQWQTIKPNTFPVLTAIGTAPISLQKSANKTQRMLMAMNASKLSAYAELAEQVYGQQIIGSTRMANLLIENQSLKSSVQGVIRGAKVVASYPVGDTYTTELSLNFEDVFALYETQQRRKEIKSIDYF